jgi:tetratricopeptide (TPR) repeat protein
MSQRLEQEWLLGRTTLGVAAGWTDEEIHLVAELGFALAEQGLNEEALRIFEGLAALAPHAPYFQSALGALWLRMDELERAIAHLDAALKSDPQDFLALLNRGEAWMRLGDRAAARRDLAAAVTLGESLEVEENARSLARARAQLAHLDALEGGALLKAASPKASGRRPPK